MLQKDKVITAIQSLPDTFTLDDLVEVLIVLQEIEIGLKQVAEGKTLTTEEAKAILKVKFPTLEF